MIYSCTLVCEILNFIKLLSEPKVLTTKSINTNGQLLTSYAITISWLTITFTVKETIYLLLWMHEFVWPLFGVYSQLASYLLCTGYIYSYTASRVAGPVKLGLICAALKSIYWWILQLQSQLSQGRIQEFYNGVSISKKLKEYSWN